MQWPWAGMSFCSRWLEGGKGTGQRSPRSGGHGQFRLFSSSRRGNNVRNDLGCSCSVDRAGLLRPATLGTRLSSGQWVLQWGALESS